MKTLLVVLALAGGAFAQEGGGSFSGRVIDATGASVPGAEVVALHVDTGAVRKATAGGDGAYAFPNLPIGNYEISATREGFKKAVRRGIELHVSEHQGVDIALEVGNLSQEVSVTATAEQVQTESSEQGGVVTGEQVRELQLNGRNFMTLMELIPGVSSNMPDRADPIDHAVDLSVNGARTSAAGFGIDGAGNPSIVGSTVLNTFTSVDSIAEFTVLTSTFSAEYGRSGVSQVNVVTKGGTRQFHGSLYHFTRNDALDATDYFSHQVLPLKLNNFGFTIGGPVVLPHYNRDRKKTFFFFTQEWNLITSRGQAVNTTVPGAAERQGDFSGLGPGADRMPGTADDPVVDPDTKLGFPGGIIPRSRMDPNALKLLSLYPLPNFKGPGSINFTSAAASRTHWREDMIRVDHNFSPAFKLYGRVILGSSTLRNPYGGQVATSATSPFPGFAATETLRMPRNFVVNASNVIRGGLLNQFNFSYGTLRLDQNPSAGPANRTNLGLTIPELYPENNGNLVPTISMSTYGSLAPARAGYVNLFNYDLSDNLTKIAGRHVIKLGAVYFYGGDHEVNTAVTNGMFSFSTNYSKHPVANLLLGLPYSYQEADKTLFAKPRYAMFEAFVQDDFKATTALTLNVGLRYSAYFNPWDANNVLSNFLPSRFDPSRAPSLVPSNGQIVAGTGDALNGIIVAGKNSPWGRGITEDNTLLLGPRIGFAWSPFRSKKTAIRGGYGIYFNRAIVGSYVNCGFTNPPFSRTVTILQPRLDNPGGGAEAAASPPTLIAMGTPMLTPTVQQWSFGVQQEMVRGAVLGVSYVASHGTHLIRPLNINDPLPGAAAAAKVNANVVRPYPGYGSITERRSEGNSIYHSLQVSFNRRMARRLSAGLAYTFAKSIDDASSDRGSSDIPPNNRNIRAERGPSDFDRKHILTGNFIWNLPDAAPRGGNAVARAALNGWQFSGIVRLWSGRPFDVVMSSDVAGIGTTQNQRPDVIADTRGPRTAEQWFNRDAFARPAGYSFGNMGRNSLRGPGVNKWDLSLFKNFTVTEVVRLQFRSEFFNAFNHPSFAAVGANLNTTTAGVNPNINNFAVVTSTRDARVLQFALKLLF